MNMKRICKLSLILILSLLLSSCSMLRLALQRTGEPDLGNEERINEQFYIILDAMESKDKEKLKSVFAPAIIQAHPDLDERIDELFLFYDPPQYARPVEWGGCSEEGKYESESRFVHYEASATYDLITTKEAYRLALTMCTEDTATPDNIGITSIYITKTERIGDLYCAYWGGGNDAPGIHIKYP